MAGHIRRTRTWRAVEGAAVAVLGWLVWRLTAHEAPPAEAIASVLGWGLGLLPVHVTLRAPHRRAAGRRVRRPAEEHRARAGRAREYGSWAYAAPARGARPEPGERQAPEKQPPEGPAADGPRPGADPN